MLGDEEKAQLEQAYRAFAGDVWRAVYAFSGGIAEVADEAIAEAFAQAGGAMDTIQNLRPWLYTAAFRIAKGELKLRSTRLPLERERGSSHTRIEAPLEEGIGEMLDLLRAMSPNQRAALVLRDVYGYSSRESAELLGISDVAVRVHLHAARRRLRSQLQEVERA